MIRGWSFVPGTPVVRGYDSSPLFREDCLERIRQLQLQFESDMKKVRQAERKRAPGPADTAMITRRLNQPLIASAPPWDVSSFESNRSPRQNPFVAQNTPNINPHRIGLIHVIPLCPWIGVGWLLDCGSMMLSSLMVTDDMSAMDLTVRAPGNKKAR